MISVAVPEETPCTVGAVDVLIDATLSVDDTQRSTTSFLDVEITRRFSELLSSLPEMGFVIRDISLVADEITPERNLVHRVECVQNGSTGSESERIALFVSSRQDRFVAHLMTEPSEGPHYLDSLSHRTLNDTSRPETFGSRFRS